MNVIYLNNGRVWWRRNRNIVRRKRQYYTKGNGRSLLINKRYMPAIPL